MNAVKFNRLKEAFGKGFEEVVFDTPKDTSSTRWHKLRAGKRCFKITMFQSEHPDCHRIAMDISPLARKPNGEYQWIIRPGSCLEKDGNEECEDKYPKHRCRACGHLSCCKHTYYATIDGEDNKPICKSCYDEGCSKEHNGVSISTNVNIYK